MSCLEHECWGCGKWWHDNTMYAECPDCKASNVTNWFDEEGEEEKDLETQDEESEDDGS